MPEAPLLGCCEADTALLPPERALERLVAATAIACGTETLPAHRVAGRVLAEPIVAPTMLPPFDHSAMDGYALHAADLGAAQAPRLLRRIAAGEEAGAALLPGTAVRVLTGAPVPPGTAAVIMEEQVTLLEDRLVLGAAVKPGQNIRRAGEDIMPGTPLLGAGRRLGARHVAMLAALGIGTVVVRSVPRIGVLSSGNELLRGQVRDSNRAMLLALLQAVGAQPRDLGIVADDAALLADVLRRAAPDLDMIVSTGGVAGSEADALPEAVALAGGWVETLRLAQKPGKPLGHGAIGTTRCLLLPGNPVAALAGMLTLGLPVMDRLGGALPDRGRTFEVSLAVPLRRQPGRLEYRPARRIGTDAAGLPLVEPLGQGGSASLRPLADAEGLLCLPAAAAELAAGARLTFLPFPAGC